MLRRVLTDLCDMRTVALLLGALAVAGPLIFVSGRIEAAEIELSVETQDRRNQIGSVVTEWTASAFVDLPGWKLNASIGVAHDEYSSRPLLAASVRKEGRISRFVFGIDRLPDWGYSRTAPLVLSSSAPPLPQLGWAVRFGRAEYEKLAGELDSGAKYLLAHRLTLRPLDDLELSVAEVSIVSKKVAGMAIHHAPLWPVYLSQHLGLGGVKNSEINVNIAVGGRWRLPWGVVHGELFVDDLPQDLSTSAPHLVAGQLGYQGEIMVESRPAIFGVEYSRLNNWMYTFRDLRYSYTHDGRLIGHWLGPDSDLTEIWLRFPLDARLTGSHFTSVHSVTFSYRRVRHGEGKVGDKWRDYGPKYAHRHAFLSGVVEAAHLLGAGVEWSLGEHVRLNADVRLGSVINAGNVTGKRDFRSEAAVKLTASW